MLCNTLTHTRAFRHTLSSLQAGQYWHQLAALRQRLLCLSAASCGVWACVCACVCLSVSHHISFSLGEGKNTSVRKRCDPTAPWCTLILSERAENLSFRLDSFDHTLQRFFKCSKMLQSQNGAEGKWSPHRHIASSAFNQHKKVATAPLGEASEPPLCVGLPYPAPSQ